jgi:hypothetical protein
VPAILSVTAPVEAELVITVPSPDTLFTFADDVLQVEQLMAPAALMLIGEVPLRPAVPILEMAIELGKSPVRIALSTKSVPLLRR